MNRRKYPVSWIPSRSCDQYAIQLPTPIPYETLAKAQAVQREHGVDEADPLFVFNNSPPRVRCAVECFATYFKRTFGYDFLQYVVEDCRDDERSCAALLWRPDYEGVLPVGAAGLEIRHDGSGGVYFGLSWAWMHPYFRGRAFSTGGSLFAKAWPAIRRVTSAVGRFAIEPPISREMKGFLRARGEEFEGQSILLKPKEYPAESRHG